ncbi:MAG TPA: M28 family peptidase [Allosphingosinicella sp.]|nr:M28 family peptidase [Allosphingosinicella sp.]
MKTPLLLAALAAAPSFAQSVPPAQPPLAALADQVSEERLRATVERLVGFGTRHTLSVRDHPTRGIGAALNWTEAEFRRFSRACGGCLAVVRPSDTVTNRRIPTPTLVEDVIAIQRGTGDPDRVIVITGHIDSRVSDPMNATADAPGANDDGSGTAAVIEAARVLSRHRFPATIVYAALSGEEQGLNGGKILADYARAQDWRVEANLNNDIVGNSCSSDGVCDDAHVRVFSEGPRWQGHEDLAARQRSMGGENDAPGRNLSRFIDRLADDLALGLDVRPIWRNDRFGRGGDHTEFLNAGFPAVRFTVAIENYNWQHQDLRTENGIVYGDTIDHMDFPYLRRVTQLNVATIAALARAPMPPAPDVEGAVSTDTTLRWATVPGARAYIVRWRRTDASQWQESRRVLDACTVRLTLGPHVEERDMGCRVVLRGVRVDDWVFGVSSVAADGSESPVASAVPGGAFAPYTPPPPQQ